MALRISPREVAGLRELNIVDVRTLAERTSVGYLPGSIGLHEGEPLASCLAGHEGLPVVVVCTSGRRSQKAADELALRSSTPVYSLDGGALAWQDSALPTCAITPPEDVPRLTELARFPRLLLSCFAAEAAENSLDGNASAAALDPVSVVNAALAEPSAPPGSFNAMLRALDRVAAVARRHRFPLDKIAENTDRLQAALAALRASRG